MLKILFLLLGAFAASAGSACANALQATQDPAAVTEQAGEFLRKQAMAYPGTPKIAIDASRLDNLPACEQLEFFLSGDGRLRSRSSLGVRCAGPQPWTSYVQATVSIEGKYFVPAHNLNAGEALEPADLETRRADLLSLPPDTVIEASQLLGRIAKHRLIAGAPVKSNALRDPQSILRGQTVRLEARGAGFVASSEGKAMQTGAPGVQIQVRTANGRIVTGTIIDGATVAVMM